MLFYCPSLVVNVLIFAHCDITFIALFELYKFLHFFILEILSPKTKIGSELRCK